LRRSVDPSLPPPPPQRASALATAAPAVRPMAPIGAPSSRSSNDSSGGSSRAATVRRSTGMPASSARRQSAATGSGAVVRRSPVGASAGSSGSEPSTIRRAISAADTGADAANTPLQDENALPPMIAALHSTGGQLDFVDWIVEQVEDRVVAELQRRGGRFREDF
ncbi:MAG: hypothetical protein ABMA25_13045, partial [Ilumatobacteraceae bacterium]